MSVAAVATEILRVIRYLLDGPITNVSILNYHVFPPSRPLLNYNPARELTILILLAMSKSF